MKNERKDINLYSFLGIVWVAFSMLNWAFWVESMALVFFHHRGAHKLFEALLSFRLWVWLLGLYYADFLFRQARKSPPEPPSTPPGPPATGNGAA